MCSKYITSLTRTSKQNLLNIAYINRQVNMQTSSNETTPSDDDAHDNDVDDDDDDEEHMDETDFSIVKNIMHRTTLDNRKTSNVFCCGDTKGGVLHKLLGQGNKKNATKDRPGQAVQVIINEHGLTEILDEDVVSCKYI